MKNLDRRELLGLAATAVPVLMQAQVASAAPAKMFLSIHEATSGSFDFKTAMEGYAKAGIRFVEPLLAKLREFAQKESPAAAGRLLSDLGLKAVSSGMQGGLVETSENRARNLEDLKWKLELAQAIGCPKMVVIPSGPGPFTKDDYKRGADNLHEAAEIARPFHVTLMLEALRARLYSTIPTALKLVREANHPNAGVMLETFDFWIGAGKMEHLDDLREGELLHVHFEDVPAEPPTEIQASQDRVFPGEGIMPLRRIVHTLKQKKYTGALSVEMFSPLIQAMDPYEAARKARATVEPFLV